MSVAIVALPEQDEDVWEVSSDKKPHMTLLFLGELSDVTGLMQIRSYLEHVVSTMHRFWMDVDRRGTLGPEDADVLFFGKHNVKWLEEVRGHLLANTDIKKAYNAAPQFDSWIPHLTLGWPDNPAKDNAIDRKIYGVRFDRLALWIADSEGPEFILPNDEGMEVAMTDRLSDFLSHYGVKGMKWGVRKRSSGRSGGSGKTKFTKPANKLSNEEINRRIKRLETEKRYNSLNSEDKSKGRQFVEGVLTSSGRTVAKSVATATATVAIKAALEAHGSTLAREVARRLG